jgi:hypothetical protein
MKPAHLIAARPERIEYSRRGKTEPRIKFEYLQEQEMQSYRNPGRPVKGCHHLLACAVFIWVVAAMIEIPTTASATGLVTPLYEVNHIRLACTLISDFAVQTKIDIATVCTAAQSALEDLTSGKLETIVGEQSRWSTIRDPDAALRECFAKTGAGGSVINGACERDMFELFDSGHPVRVVPTPFDSISVNDPAAVTIAVQCRIEASTAIRLSVEYTQPANGYAQRTWTSGIVQELVSQPEGTTSISLHQTFQVLFSKFLGPFDVNMIKARARALSQPKQK